MTTYSFTCPLQGCSQKMTLDTDDPEVAAKNLSAQAQQHLQNVHPDVHKTDQEVEEDIRAHMVKESD